MGLISKVNTFSPATTISSTQVNTNFDDLYNVLNGTVTTVQLKVASSDGNSPLTLNQTSSNYSQEWQNAGVTVIRMKKTGVLESLVTTGTAPFIVASTTKVTNLNADTVDGLHSSSFAQISSGVLTVTGSIPKIIFDRTAGVDWSLRVNSSDDMILSDGTGTLGTWNTASGNYTAVGQVKTDQSAPAAASDLTRKDYVDSKQVKVAIGGFFPGAASTSASRPSFVVPQAVSNLYVRKFRAVYQAGTNTGTTTVQWVLNGVGKDTIDITTQASDTLITVDISPDVQLSDEDIIYFKITAEGNHADVTCELTGDMEVV